MHWWSIPTLKRYHSIRLSADNFYKPATIRQRNNALLPVRCINRGMLIIDQQVAVHVPGVHAISLDPDSDSIWPTAWRRIDFIQSAAIIYRKDLRSGANIPYERDLLGVRFATAVKKPFWRHSKRSCVFDSLVSCNRSLTILGSTIG